MTNWASIITGQVQPVKETIGPRTVVGAVNKDRPMPRRKRISMNDAYNLLPDGEFTIEQVTIVWACVYNSATKRLIRMGQMGKVEPVKDSRPKTWKKI